MTAAPALFGRPKRRRTLRGRALTVETGRRTAWLGIDGAGLVDVMDFVGTPRQWDTQRRQWMVPVDRAADVIAACEHRHGMAVTVTAVDR